MNKARDLINAHLYPVLATFAVVYGAIRSHRLRSEPGPLPAGRRASYARGHCSQPSAPVMDAVAIDERTFVLRKLFGAAALLAAAPASPKTWGGYSPRFPSDQISRCS